MEYQEIPVEMRGKWHSVVKELPPLKEGCDQTRVWAYRENGDIDTASYQRQPVWGWYNGEYCQKILEGWEVSHAHEPGSYGINIEDGSWPCIDGTKILYWMPYPPIHTPAPPALPENPYAPEAEWIEPPERGKNPTCSRCGGQCWFNSAHGRIERSKYCPNCGAKMRAKQ